MDKTTYDKAREIRNTICDLQFLIDKIKKYSSRTDQEVVMYFENSYPLGGGLPKLPDDHFENIRKAVAGEIRNLLNKEIDNFEKEIQALEAEFRSL